MRRILLYLNEAKEETIELALSLAQTFSSRLYVLFCLNSEEIKNEELKDKKEDEGWQKLYDIEEKAFKREIKVSLLFFEGKPEELITELIKSYEVDTLILNSFANLNLLELINKNKEKIIILK
ncbi:MAG: universal stress protein [candidate division WOR-3 bacterium]|nr:universal stress protein [candidate division WOR-3 bacterium]MCX7836996.1 universal stress protein [candidate division WOR-3 bacterium]MDW8114074.1 universal stress protein [candidate division WOR-3 bacterium]